MPTPSLTTSSLHAFRALFRSGKEFARGTFGRSVGALSGCAITACANLSFAATRASIASAKARSAEVSAAWGDGELEDLNREIVEVSAAWGDGEFEDLNREIVMSPRLGATESLKT